VSDYPEHDKMQAMMKLADFTQHLGEWLEFNNYTVCQLVCKECRRPAHSPEVLEVLSEPWHHQDTEWARAPVAHGIQGLLAEMFDVDLDKIEQEKRAMLAALRAAN
jgi:hypothetical protein